MRVIFVDRDGTIVNSKSKKDFITDYSDVSFLDGSLEALDILVNQLYYQIIIISNQTGVSRGYMDLYQCWSIQHQILAVMAKKNIDILATYICPHDEIDHCLCRKPQQGLLNYAKNDYPNININSSFMVGDRLTDIKLGQEGNLSSILVRTGVDAKAEMSPHGSLKQSLTDNIILSYDSLLDFTRHLQMANLYQPREIDA